jgi:hypothetical protein
MSGLSVLERQLLDEVSAPNLFGIAEKLAGWDRVSGMEGEGAAAGYLRERLEAAGLSVTEHRPACLLSWPQHASLNCLDAPPEFDVLSHSFSASTPDAGLEAALAWGGSEAGPQRPEAAGSIVVLEGVPRAAAVSAAERAGAVGVVFTSAGEVVLVDRCERRPLGRHLVLRVDSIDGTGVDTGAAVDALVGIDEVLLGSVVAVDAVDRADLDTGSVLEADAGLGDPISHRCNDRSNTSRHSAAQAALSPL